MQPATHSPGRFAGLTTCLIGTPDGASEPVPVEEAEFRPPHVLMRFGTIPDRTAAQALIGKYVMVEDSGAMPPPEGSWFVHDIIGCEVRGTDGTIVGTVGDVLKLPAQDVWEIRTPGGTVMFPAVREFIERVDTGARLIIIRPPEGLLDGKT